MSDQNRYSVSTFPHIHSGISIRRLMIGIIIALLPPLGFGVVQYGLPAALIIIVSVLGAFFTEFGIDLLAKRKTVKALNLHSVVVGLMLAAMLPSGCPLPIVLLGSVMAILIGKIPFGSLGGSFIAPAILGILILFVSYPKAVTNWQFPNQDAEYNETYAAESPLQAVYTDPSDEYEYSPVKMFTGQGKVGAIGATSGLALTIGAFFLFFMRITRMYATLGYLIGLCATAFVLGKMYPEEPTVWFHLVSGYALFAAMFLVNDIPASPVTETGMILYGVIAGALTIVLRWAGLEFASALFAVAVTSLAVPFLDKLIGKPAYQSEVTRA
ncbi:MAG: RnfABCDGE type electron transport complex subunit D [Deltaproteobacteria bacterium]|nr:RnfABCDGE type electron transport complex subunit D [Deltaproteobacteria bacterium]MBN2671449.1 RnfABCDGE type electron transport complex subunit D [Deltaproteobacteria bacterium]